MKHSSLQIKNVSVQIGDTVILKDINLSINSGEMVMLIGPNGSGKTTLFKAMIGDIPYKGEISFSNSEGKTGRPLTGYVPQKLTIDSDSPLSVLDFFGAALGKRPVWLGSGRKFREKVKRDLAETGVENLVDRRLGKLSGGELQRVLFALALDPLPDLLLLDEPFSAVDQNGLETFYDIVAGLAKKHNIIVIIVSHELEHAERLAEKVIFLNHSIQAFGTPAEVFANEKFRQVFKNS